nr:hypothetical protein [Treponema sp.]
MKKFSFKEFIQLDITSLLSVNGGSCSSTSPSSNSGGSNSSSSNSSGSSGNNGSGGGGSTSSSSRSKGGTSVCVNTGYGTSTTRTYDKHGNESSKSTTKVNGSGGSGSFGSYSSSGSSGGGSCSSSSSGKVYTNTYYKSSTSSSSLSVSGQGSGVTGSNGGTLCGGGHTEDVSGGSCSSGGKVNKSEEPAIMEPVLTAAEEHELKMVDENTMPFVCKYSEEEMKVNPLEKISTGSESDSSKMKTPVSGSFEKLTEGSYQDDLTMQYYLKQGIVDRFAIDASMNDEIDANGNIKYANYYSKHGCVMTGIAKILSEMSGKRIDIDYI